MFYIQVKIHIDVYVWYILSSAGVKIESGLNSMAILYPKVAWNKYQL